MIPALILPVIGRLDLFDRLVASIDEPVGRMVVIDMTADGIGALGANADIACLHRSIGYPGAINLGIGLTPEAPWWLFASADIAFGPGDLREIASLMEVDDEPCVVTGDRRDSRLLRWTYGAVNRAAVERVGLPDEWTFHPIYFDDDDYERRCRLGGVEWIEYNGSILHGEDGTVGSTTIKSDPAAAAGNARTFAMNRDAYAAKWGGLPGHETFATPWNLPVPLSFTRPDPAARAARTW